MTTKKLKTPAPKVRVTGSCQLFATFDMVCPLCAITVPANTVHHCEKRETTR